MKKIFTFLIAGLLVFSAMTITAAASGGQEKIDIFAGGIGTEMDPFQISSEAQLRAFAESVNKGEDYENQYIVLTTNITIQNEWTPIGTGARSGGGLSNDSHPFKGSFDGKNCSISDLQIAVADADSGAYGLFGCVDGGTVKNIEFTNANVATQSTDGTAIAVGILTNGGTVSNVITDESSSVKGYQGVGGIVGRILKKGTVSECENNATVSHNNKESSYNIGGIVGAAYYNNEGMSIKTCENNGGVTGNYTGVGGIVGFSVADIAECVNTGDVSGKGASIGGIVGEQQNAGSVTGCSNEGDVKNEGENFGTGGIIGWVRYTGAAATYSTKKIIEIKDNKNTGSITGGGDAGGIVGRLYNAAMVCGNENFAPMISSSNFAAGIVGSLQFTEQTDSNIPFIGVKIISNISATAEEQIAGTNKNLIAYNNHTGELEEGQYIDIADNSSAWAAQIKNQRFGTLEGAIQAAKSGDIVKLLKSVDVSENGQNLTIGADKELILDLAGFEITAKNTQKSAAVWIEGTVEITDSSDGTGKIIAPAGKKAITVSGTGALTLTGGTLEASHGIQVQIGAQLLMQGGKINAETRGISIITQNGAGRTSVTIDGGEITTEKSGENTAAISVSGGNGTEETNNASLTVIKGSIVGGAYGIAGNGSSDNTTIEIRGGSISGKVTAIYHPQVGNMTISGGEITGANGVQFSGAGTLTISGDPVITATGAYTEFPSKPASQGDGTVNDGAAVSVVSRGGGYQSEGDEIIVQISGGTLTSENNAAVAVYRLEKQEGTGWVTNDQTAVSNYLESLRITGGTFASGAQKGVFEVDPAAMVEGEESVVVSGGKFDEELDAVYLAPGYKPVDLGGGQFGVQPEAVAPSTYAVQIEKSENGAVTSSSAYAAQGTQVTLRTAPADGYVLESISVTDAAGKVLTLTELGNGEYSFSMPASAVRVKAVFSEKDHEANCPSRDFTDVDQNAWYHEAVDYALETGLMDGMGDYVFAPQGNLSRAMMAQLLYNMEGRPTVSGTSPFDDVAEEAWYKDAVTWASAVGLVQGYGDGSFAPESSITREQLALFLYNYATFKGEENGARNDLSAFEDENEVSSWAREAVEWAVAVGLVQGRGDGQLDSTGTAARAEVAQILVNYSQAMA